MSILFDHKGGSTHRDHFGTRRRGLLPKRETLGRTSKRKDFMQIILVP